MNSENIIGINIANGVSITIMAAVGLLVWSMVRKAAMGRSNVGNAPMANQVS